MDATTPTIPATPTEPTPTEKFSKSLSGLLKFMLKVMRERENNRISTTPNPVIIALTKYRDAVEDAISANNITEHVEFFTEVYLKNRRDICRGYLNDHWIRRNDSTAFFSYKGKKISLSLIYDISCTIREKAERELDGLPGASEGNPSLVYPEAFLLHLYRIFRECCVIDKDLSAKPESKGEIEILTKNIVKLEELLSLRPPDPKSDTTQKDLALPQSQNSSSPMNALAGIMSNLNMGGNGQFDASSIFNMISGMASNMDPRMKQGLDEIASEVKGKDLMGAMSTLINKVTSENPEMATEVKKAFGTILPQAAIENVAPSAPSAPAVPSAPSAPSNEVEYEL